MILGVDAGNGRVKVAGAGGAIDFDAALGEYRERNLVSTHGPDDMEVEWQGSKFFAGSLARHESEYGGSIMGDTKAHTDCLLRVLVALHRYNASEEVSIVVGQPIGRHCDSEKQKIKAMLRGQHETTVNGAKRCFVIFRVEVAAEGAAAIWAAPRGSALTHILDIGSGTINGATISAAGNYIDRDSWTIPFGLHTSKSNNDNSAMADGIARRALKKWNRSDRVLLVGGGAEDLAPHLQRHFPNAEILRPVLAGRQLHPIYANACGFYQIARGIYAENRQKCSV